MSLKLDLPHSYQLELIEELPGSGQLPQFYFGGSFFKSPHRESNTRTEGLLLRVISSDKKIWIAVAKESFDLPGSGVYSTFDPEKFCIVAGGYGCFVNAANPELPQAVRALPVTDVRIIEDRSMFVFADYTRLCAYGRAGLIWENTRVCQDGLKIVSINKKTIDGTGYDPTSDTDQLMQFSVDLETGESLLPPHPTW
jgi:hypothetical protein